MNDPFPAIAEASATGETADLFADIRATVGVRVVNLVWRHLAMLDGALPWAWAAVKPLYLDGLAEQAAQRFRETMIVPKLASLAGDAPASVDAVLASYDHSNTINLFALGALVSWLGGEAGGAPPLPLGLRLKAPDVVLPVLASEADVTPETWALVRRLNRFGDTAQPLILASMYRHLAHAPAFLRRVEAALVPVQADGSLDRAIAANRTVAHEAAKHLAQSISTQRPPLADKIETSVSAFIDHAIGKMVTICRAIRVARGTPL
ncbi:MAG: hypothetical protein EPO55_25605 [Reyranella sp.]|uniref:hypothetical protein n=1 Tax=Reyranella sp. TaxID=1929291 RepID=UPI00121701E6|nr:hypothetical protein [Reyranella sp.]TAJ35410.1 MAG: hypothetical protein EPO55_25605 [Reyranella sp.]